MAAASYVTCCITYGALLHVCSFVHLKVMIFFYWLTEHLVRKLNSLNPAKITE
jgi:hypothetical protein